MKKALLYIDSMQKGGAQRVMSVLGKYLCNQGVITVLINDIASQKGREEYPIDARIRRVFLDQDNMKGKYKNFHRVKKLREIVKMENPDVILSFMGPPNYRMLTATLGLHCRKVVSVRNDPYKEYGNTRIKRLIAGLLFRLADGCVFQTEMASEYFPKCVRRKSNIILNPVNPEFFYVQWNETENSLITVGRLYPQKNHELLIRAFSQVHKDMPGISLKICGRGVEEQRLKQLVQELRIEDCVHFLGEINDVKEQLKHSSCFVLSSDYEGLPNALMEAMAVGMPVISTDCPCGGPNELIKDEKNGLLVPCGNAGALEDAIRTMLSGKEVRIAFGQKAKESASAFQTDIVMNCWMEYLFTNRNQ